MARLLKFNQLLQNKSIAKIKISEKEKTIFEKK